MGGGSGGHVTPVVAVLHELKIRHPEAEIRFWCDRYFADSARVTMGDVGAGVPVDTIISGKLRRYNHLSLWQHITMPGIVFPNIIDIFKVFFGFIQSFAKLIAWRPGVVFLKGGFVCLPVGWAARLLRIPYVIHDSDAHPGLTNRLLSRGAAVIATGAPLEYYSYPASKTKYVGIPVDEKFRVYSPKEQQAIRQDIQFVADKPVIVATGGGLGAARINQAILFKLSEYRQLANLALVAGAQQYDELRAQVGLDSSDFKLYPFVPPEKMQQLLAAADVVITRAGATTMLELAALGRATVMVPNARLTAGHQVKNAKVYADAGAGLIVEEIDDGDIARLANDIYQATEKVLKDDKLRSSLERSIQKLAKPEAAREVALMLEAAYQPVRKEPLER